MVMEMDMDMEKNINRILTYNKSAKETWQIFFYIYDKKNEKIKFNLIDIKFCIMSNQFSV